MKLKKNKKMDYNIEDRTKVVILNHIANESKNNPKSNHNHNYYLITNQHIKTIQPQQIQS